MPNNRKLKKLRGKKCKKISLKWKKGPPIAYFMPLDIFIK
tara:strand:- start:506 stop:625 length:120 start_codon:yes stop_codon:yes gene_type:complete